MATIAKRVQKHRMGLRKSGLRPVQIWVPDTRRKGFAAECRRQSRLLKLDPHETEVLEWIRRLIVKVGRHEAWRPRPYR